MMGAYPHRTISTPAILEAMSWESIPSREYLSGTASHQLSATALLPSPDGPPHPRPLDLFEFREEGEPRGGGRTPRRNPGLWDCLLGCRRSLEHSLARRRVEQGLRLYNQHKQQAAVSKWKSALKRIRKRDDKFLLLGYLYQAYMDWGKYRESLEFAHRQLGLAEDADSPSFKAEAYLNLARTHERLGALERALAYARHSLFNECDQCRTAGHVHLTVGNVHMQLASFCPALEAFQQAHKIAQNVKDPALELQVYVGLSELFARLQDAEKSAKYASKAYDLSRSLQLGDLNSRHHRAALLQMAAALRKQGELGDAQDYCSEATRLSLVSGDQATYARSIRVMGDIYRKKCDINRAFRQYEMALGLSSGLGDRLSQMETMEGMAKCLEALRLQRRICNCRPLEFNSRLLELASSIGAKLLVRNVRDRLARIYHNLGDEEQQAHQERLVSQLDEELELVCGACALPYGCEADSLEALPCAHILHARCAYELLRHRGSKKRGKGARQCPDCQRLWRSGRSMFWSKNWWVEEKSTPTASSSFTRGTRRYGSLQERPVHTRGRPHLSSSLRGGRAAETRM